LDGDENGLRGQIAAELCWNANDAASGALEIQFLSGRSLRMEMLLGDFGKVWRRVPNFANGRRNAQEIRDAVSAEYGPVPLEMVVEYLKALEKIGVVVEVKPEKGK